MTDKSNNLIEIAKACGAFVATINQMYPLKEGEITMNEAQLQATIDAVNADSIETNSAKTTPYTNCQFDICDLPGQCKGEGKCHHPKFTVPPQVNDALEKAGKVCDDICQSYLDAYRTGRQPYDEGAADCADECSRAIRALINKG